MKNLLKKQLVILASILIGVSFLKSFSHGDDKDGLLRIDGKMIKFSDKGLALSVFFSGQAIKP